MTRLRQAGLVAGALVLAAACAAARRPGAAASPSAADGAARVAATDALVATGRYTALAEARRVLAEALDVPALRPAAVERFVRASIALGLRERDLGVLGERTTSDASALAAAEPALARYAPWIEVLDGIVCKVKGSPGIERIGGRTLDGHLDWVRDRVPGLDKDLAQAAAADDLAAALRIQLRREFAFKFADKLDEPALRDLHPGSKLLAFEAAVGPSPRTAELEKLLAADPDFVEVRYYLGDAALSAGRLLTAETHLRAALDGVPDSLSLLISLAKAAFQMEEFEACLDWNEKALALLPTYRDALLGRGLALGYLGRNEEALAVLGRMLELGTYYMGEGHYWTAWNLHQLGRLEEARRAVEAARVFLVGVAGVETLSGLIAYAQGRLDDAEKDLRRALDLDPAESDAAFHLGRLCADRKAWLDSGIYFAGAAMVMEDKEKGLEARLAEIEASTLPPERKARLAARKRFQIEGLRATKATSQYNGAAGYHNAGSFERALELARRSASHPAFAERAAALIKLIGER